MAGSVRPHSFPGGSLFSSIGCLFMRNKGCVRECRTGELTPAWSHAMNLQNQRVNRIWQGLLSLCYDGRRESALFLPVGWTGAKKGEGNVTIRIVIADDHKVVRQGLRLFLHVDPELAVVGEAGNGAEALALARELRPDVVLMDVLMPVMDGIAATEAIRRELPDTEVLALTSVLGDSPVIEVMRAGAIGYLLKDVDGDELCRAIHAAAAGKVQLAPEAAAFLLRELRTTDQVEPLTARETEVLRLLGQGQSNREIARSLHLKEETVKTHVSKILSKLGVRSRTQAAIYALRSGLLTHK